ncbi:MULTISPECIES: HetP family heterocyst commitment protein [unclassified Anabaena]|uniref:HetP family heterocyst commitment protein n=1 Tax=unclassified Anabaena TaxID=2619674 RepID=UPI00082C0681|nr:MULTISPECIES: HetP family heterocyst commitment protein [unclassified Anabaena]
MNHQFHSSQQSFQNAITIEQLNQIIAAITDGRYSWACVLILRFVGYNPLHFIPQRTYSRLMKENRQVPNVTVSANSDNPENLKSSSQAANSHHNNSSQQVKHQVRNSSRSLEPKIAELYRQQS